MDIKTNEHKHEKQEQNDKLDNEGVSDRRQLKPYVVNISFKYETSGRGKEGCKGTRKGGRRNSGKNWDMLLVVVIQGAMLMTRCVLEVLSRCA